MSFQFDITDMSDALNRALEFEEEQDEQEFEIDESPEDQFILRLSPIMEKRINANQLNISKFILCTDDISAGFTDTYLLGNCATKVGVVVGPSCCEEENTVHQNSFWDKSCFLYCLEDSSDVIVCQSKRPIESKFLFNWIKTVFSKIIPNQVIVLSSTPISKMQLSTNGNDILRQLTTDTFTLSTGISQLERPNLIKDLPAAAMTYCHVHRIPAILYLLATESHLFDVVAVKSFAQVLKDQVFSAIPKPDDTQLKVALKKLCSLRIPDNGVYI